MWHVHAAFPCLPMSLLHVRIHVHSAFSGPCSIDMDMQQGCGHAAGAQTKRPETCSMDMGTQHRHGNAAWTGVWSMDRGSSMGLDMQHGQRHGCRLLLDHWGQWTTLFSEGFAEELAEVSKS
jgi:hypothetical protein